MKKINSIIGAIIVVVLFSSVSLLAKDNKHLCEKKKCNKEGRTLSQEMADRLNQIKNEFDSKLSEDDLNSLIKLRELVKSQKLAIKTNIFELRKSDLSKAEKKKRIKEVLELNNEKRDNVKTELKAILERNKENVDVLVLKLKDLRQSSVKKSKNRKLDQKRNIAKFILHDKFMATDYSFKDKFKNTQKLDIIVNKDVLTFSYATESIISTITLYDLNGNKISVLTNYNIKEGENSINLTKFNTNLEKGRYFLVIENNNNINTGKFIYFK